MNKKTALLLGVVGIALTVVVGLTVYLVQSQQDTRSRADTSTPIQTTPPAEIAQSCPLPAQVQNVQVEFPNCVGDTCNFTQASCSWSSVSGATKYQVSVSQVESGESVKNEQVDGTVVRVEFPVVQNKTYKCDVAAINSCGSTGPAGSHTLLCEADALVSTPTPVPATPTPQKVACGFSCTSNANCDAGQVCTIGAGGQGYCALPSLEAACKSAPSISSCCVAQTQAPPPPTSTPIPTLPPTGLFDATVGIGVGALLLTILGGVILLW